MMTAPPEIGQAEIAWQGYRRHGIDEDMQMIAQPTTTPLGFTHPDDVSHILYALRDLRMIAARADALGYPLHARYLESAARFLRAGAAIWLDNAAGSDE